MPNRSRDEGYETPSWGGVRFGKVSLLLSSDIQVARVDCELENHLSKRRDELRERLGLVATFGDEDEDEDEDDLAEEEETVGEEDAFLLAQASSDQVTAAASAQLAQERTERLEQARCAANAAESLVTADVP